jgi:hypothetical protein
MSGQGGRRGTWRVLCGLLLGAAALLSVPAAAQAQIDVGDVRAAEGTGSLTFTITRQVVLVALPATVAFATADGSATAPADYAAASGNLTFPAALGSLTQAQRVTVSLARDGIDEPDETLRLAISGAGVSDAEGIGTIADDDALPTVGVADAPPAAEGAAARFTIRLSRASGRAVSVAYATADGSAAAGQDYGARSGRVEIPAGSTTAVPVSVSLLDDNADEPDEAFELRLSAPSAVTLGDAAGAATIVDNDATPAGAAPAKPGPGPGGSGLPPPAVGGSGDVPSALRLGVSSPRLRQPATVLVTIACPRPSGRCSGRTGAAAPGRARTASGRCSGRLTLFSRPSKRSKIKQLRKERRLGRRSFDLPGGGAQTLRLVLSRRDRALLKRAGRMPVRAYVATTDAAGRSGVRRVNGTLVARTSHSG